MMYFFSVNQEVWEGNGGIEGAQLIELPNSKIILNGVCFLPEGPFTPAGKKQRFFVAIANKVEGPYKILAPVIEPTKTGWESGENGHATGIVEGNTLKFFYHARDTKGRNPVWRYRIATLPLTKFLEVLSSF